MNKALTGLYFWISYKIEIKVPRPYVTEAGVQMSVVLVYLGYMLSYVQDYGLGEMLHDLAGMGYNDSSSRRSSFDQTALYGGFVMWRLGWVFDLIW